MKKLVPFLLMAAMLFSCPMLSAQSKAMEKARAKEYKAKMKEYKKEGWTLFGSSRSLDMALLNHYEKLNQGGDNVREVVGIATRFKSKNVGHQMAVNSACLTYSQQAGSYVKGRVVSDMAGDGIDAEKEFEHFYAAYERLVEKEIKGEMRESYSVIRDNGDGTFEMQTFFIIDEDAATEARIRAYENAMRETEAAQKHAQNVADFVRAGFPVTQ